MVDANLEMKERIAQTFARAAGGYRDITHFPPLGRRLVELTEIPAGARVLDVACGRGAILFPAAEKAGSSGEVIGVDISPGMVEQTALEAMRMGLGNVDVRQMDAEALDFADSSFDVVLCGFALQFLPHLDRGLGEFRRVLKPGGHLAVSIWGADDERFAWYKQMRLAYQANLRLQSQSFEKPELLEGVFDEAGYCDVKVLVEPFDWVCATPDEWWDAQWSMSSRAGLEMLDAHSAGRFKSEVFENLEKLRQPDGYHELLRAQFVLARRP